jgi:hypothetical protein
MILCFIIELTKVVILFFLLSVAFTKVWNKLLLSTSITLGEFFNFSGTKQEISLNLYINNVYFTLFKSYVNTPLLLIAQE